MWFFSDIDLATSFFCGVRVGFLSNAYSAYMLLIYQARTIKEEARRFYIAEIWKMVYCSNNVCSNIPICRCVKTISFFWFIYFFSNIITIFTKINISK